MAFGDDEDYDDKPVQEGETYEVEIEDLGSKGDGIARVDNFVVFVPDTEVGEKVSVEINSVGRKFAFGDVVERLGQTEVEEESDEGPEEAATPEEDEESVEESEDVEEATAENPVEELEEEEAEEPEEESLEVEEEPREEFGDEPEPEEEPELEENPGEEEDEEEDTGEGSIEDQF